MRTMHREHCLQRGHTGRLSGRRYNRYLVCPQIPTSRMRRPNYRVLAVSKLRFSLRITIIQRDLSHPRWFSLPRNSPHLMPGNVDVQIHNPLCWFRTTQKTHPSSRTPHRISWSLCCNCISVDPLSAKSCFLHSFTVLFYPRKCLHTNFRLKVCLLENLA